MNTLEVATVFFGWTAVINFVLFLGAAERPQFRSL